MTDRPFPKVGVGVLIIRDGKLLMGQRRGAHGEGTWSIPGGHLEWQESWEDCALREVLEETGLTVVKPRFAGVTNDPMPDENKHYITLFMRADYAGGEPTMTEPDKYIDLDWFSWDSLPGPRFSPLERFLQTGWKP